VLLEQPAQLVRQVQLDFQVLMEQPAQLVRQVQLAHKV
jgi:hypothetical protein